MLARMYETDVLRMLDLADHESLAPPDRLTLIRPALAASAVPPAPLLGGSLDVLGQPPADARGLLISLPYVPGRLVIEISDPAADACPVILATDGREQGSGQLSLVRDLPGHVRQVTP
jgi:hypothetical protein